MGDFVMMLRVLRRLALKGAEFARDRSASITVEFVISVPILIVILVLSTEFSRLRQSQTVLSNAVSDATRYLTRVPYDDATLTFSPGVINFAESLIRDRFNAENVQVAIGTPVVVELEADNANVTLEVAVTVPVRVLSLLDLTNRGNITLPDGRAIADVDSLVIRESETFRHFGR